MLTNDKRYQDYLQSQWTSPDNQLYHAKRAINALIQHYDIQQREFEAYRKESISLSLLSLLIKHLLGNKN